MNKVSERKNLFLIIMSLFGICIYTYLFRVVSHNIKYFFLMGDSIMIILLYRSILLFNKMYKNRVIKYNNIKIKRYK